MSIHPVNVLPVDLQPAAVSSRRETLQEEVLRNLFSWLAVGLAASLLVVAPVHAQNYGGALTAPPSSMTPSIVPPMQTLPPNSLTSPLANIHSAPEAKQPSAAVPIAPDTSSRPRAASPSDGK
jgi:hypothetical protein